MSKLVQTAKRCKEILETEDFTLDMATFCRTPSEPTYFTTLPLSVAEEFLEEVPCGTTFCLAGYMAQVDGYPKKFMDMEEEEFDFIPYSESLIGYESLEAEWLFMFSEAWPSDKDLAIKKMNFVIEHERVPTEAELYKHFNLFYGKL